MNIPQKVQLVLAERLKLLCVYVEEGMRVSAWHGDPSVYGLSDLKQGQDVGESFPFMDGLEVEEFVHLPFVGLPNGQTVHVEVLREKELLALILTDATEEHDRQQEIQQKANELDILNYRQQQLMTELEKSRKEAEAASEVKSRFIAGMSHEFRTPLTSILGYSGLLRNSSDQEEVRRCVPAIERGARHLLSLVENVLDQSRLDSRQIIINPVEMALAELIEDIESIFRPLAEQKQLSLNIARVEPLPDLISIDSVHLRQILINVVGNAFKFTEQGQVDLEFRYSDKRMHITVSDSGPGMAQAELERIFLPFERIASSNVSGTGLGLSISRQLTQMMGGKLSVESKVGLGSTFEIVMPAHQMMGALQSLGLESEDQRRVVAAGQTNTILLAEDDEDSALLIELYLTDQGYALIRASKGEDAIKLAQKNNPDLVLTDLNLPDMSGLDVIRRLRETQFRKPIIALTASSSQDDRQTALSLGCDHYLSKPIDFQQLINVIEKTCLQ